MTRFRLDLVTVISISKLSVKTTSISLVSPNNSFAPTISKAMLAVTNLSSTLVGADKAARGNQDRWICGYDSSKEGSAVARLEKILGGLRNLKMVDGEPWSKYGQTSTTILQAAEDGPDEVPFMFNHPGGNALALKLEEAVLAVSEGPRTTPMSRWRGRGVTIAGDGGTAAASQPLRYGGGLITTARPQWVCRNGTPAVGQADETPCALKGSRETHGIVSAMRLRGGGPNGGPDDGDERRRAGKRPWEGVEGAWDRPRESGKQGDDRLYGWGRPRQRQQHDVPQNPRESPLLPRRWDDHQNGWGSMLTSTNGHLHHVREWKDQATWGKADNAWRGGRLDEEGNIRYGWGNVADTFMEDPRWTDYIETVKHGDNPSLTWKQYTAELKCMPGSHQEQHGTQHLGRSQREQQSQEPQSQTARWREGATRATTATSALPYGRTSKKALKLQEHKRKVALALEQQGANEEAEVQRRIQSRRRRQEVDDYAAMAMRWKTNRGEAVTSVPLLPPELWAHILRQGRLERAQLEDWVAWANATLMKLVVDLVSHERTARQEVARQTGRQSWRHRDSRHGEHRDALRAVVQGHSPTWGGERPAPLHGNGRSTRKLRQRVHAHALHDEVPRLPQRHRETPDDPEGAGKVLAPRERPAEVHPRAARQRRRGR